MNLYKIIFDHYSQKDRERGIKGFVLAESDSVIYQHIADEYLYGEWYYVDEDEGEKLRDVYNDDYEVVGEETEREYIMRNRGNLEDESMFHDLYYGATVHGWELMKEGVDAKSLSAAIELGIVHYATTPTPTPLDD